MSKQNTPESQSHDSLNNFHQKFKEEVLEGYKDSESNKASSKSQDTSGAASHIETLHRDLHVLSGGKVGSRITPDENPNDLKPENILLFFDLYKALAEGELSQADFNPGKKYYKRFKQADSLLQGKEDIVTKIIRKDALPIPTQGDAFQAFCQQISSESKAYVNLACEWVNNLVLSGEIDAANYLNQVIETKKLVKMDGFDKSTLEDAQKVYLMSNIENLLYGKESGKAEEVSNDNVKVRTETAEDEDTLTPKKSWTERMLDAKDNSISSQR